MFIIKSGVQEWNSETTFLISSYKALILNVNRTPCSHFSFFAKEISLKVFHPQKIYQNPPHKFERPPFWNGCSYGIKNYGEVTFNGMTSLLNFIKTYQLVQTLVGGTDTG
jgi:hypothetical protein